jgi:phosphomannomutase
MANYEPDDGALTDQQIEQIKKLNMNDLKFTTAGAYMPTRLEDLMYRSGLTASGCWDQLDEYDRKAIERFAELIVLKCAEIAIDNGCGDFVDIKQILLEHFGVEL